MIVAKFGGTSVGNAQAIRRLLGIVKDRVAERPVVVVSAFAGVTDELLAAGRLAASGALRAALDKTAKLRARTLALANELLKPEPGNKTLWDLEAQLATVDELLSGAGALREFSPRTSDAVAACGELLSSRLIAAALNATGVQAEFVDSRKCMVTDGAHTRAVPLFAETELNLRQRVLPVLERGTVVVMGGFIGATANGITTTLGRGGSDFAAAIVGSCLDAERVEIWTDVNGIMTADPRVCPDATTVPEISYEQAAQLAWFGAKVVHPATLIPALEKNIRVQVLNSFSPEEPGTDIVAESRDKRRRVTAVAVKKGISLFRVSAGRSLDRQGFLQSVFDVVDRCGCAVDLVCSAENCVSVAVPASDAAANLKRNLETVGAVQQEADKAIVCLVGEDLSRCPDVMSKVFGVMQDAPVAMVSQGAWQTTFAFVTDVAQAHSVLRRIHSVLFATNTREHVPVLNEIGGTRFIGHEGAGNSSLTSGSQA